MSVHTADATKGIIYDWLHTHLFVALIRLLSASIIFFAKVVYPLAHTVKKFFFVIRDCGSGASSLLNIKY